jgi:hypothetical protein
LAGGALSASATEHLKIGAVGSAGWSSPTNAAMISRPISRQAASPGGFHHPWSWPLLNSHQLTSKFFVSKCVGSLLTETAAWEDPEKCSRRRAGSS